MPEESSPEYTLKVALGSQSNSLNSCETFRPRILRRHNKGNGLNQIMTWPTLILVPEELNV